MQHFLKPLKYILQNMSKLFSTGKFLMSTTFPTLTKNEAKTLIQNVPAIDIAWILFLAITVGIYLFKDSDRNTITMCEICSKLTIKTTEWRQWRRSVVFIVKFEWISHIVLVLLGVSIVGFEQVNASCDIPT